MSPLHAILPMQCACYVEHTILYLLVHVGAYSEIPNLFVGIPAFPAASQGYVVLVHCQLSVVYTSLERHLSRRISLRLRVLRA